MIEPKTANSDNPTLVVVEDTEVIVKKIEVVLILGTEMLTALPSFVRAPV